MPRIAVAEIEHSNLLKIAIPTYDICSSYGDIFGVIIILIIHRSPMIWLFHNLELSLYVFMQLDKKKITKQIGQKPLFILIREISIGIYIRIDGGKCSRAPFNEAVISLYVCRIITLEGIGRKT